MNIYDIKQINEYTYYINDRDFCTSYLLIGKDKAILIDTGLPSTPSLIDEVRKITDKEIIVLITHGHYDHIGHLKEFDSFYINEDDLNLINDESLRSKAILLKDNQLFDFSTFKLRVYFNKGHTLGCSIFIDETSKILYTGDQYGSGCGVWMQVPTATNISTYLSSIRKFKQYLIDNYYDPLDFIFYPGHLGQENTSLLKRYNPLNHSMLNDFEILCEKLLNNEVEFKDTLAKSFNNEKSYYVCYNNAEMIIRKSLIK